MRWLVTGAAGMLGSDVVRAARGAGNEVDARDRRSLDVLDQAAVTAAVAAADVVVNCAAWTDVDGAEAAEKAATRVNGEAVTSLATACRSVGARLVHVSTDYVFAGDATSPYAEDAPTDPINAYGRSKLVGEQAVLRELPEAGYVVRTAWLYGAQGKNFVATMARLAADRGPDGPVDVVVDQLGQPTWSGDLAQQVVALVVADAPPGVYHGTAGGQATWFDLAREVFRLTGHDPERVRPTTSAAYVRPARRPGYSVLGHDRWAAAGLLPLRTWHAALAEHLGSA